MLLLITFLFTLPKVQTSLSHNIFNQINKKYHTHIVVDRMDLSNLKNAKFYGLMVKDDYGDTIIYASEAHTALLNVRDLYHNKFKLGKTTLKNPILKLITYKGDSISAFNKFISAFDTQKKDDKPSADFILDVKDLSLSDGQFYLFDYNKQPEAIEYFTNINSYLDHFKIKNSDVSTKIETLSLLDKRGIKIENLSSDFTYSETEMNFHETIAQTEKSLIKGDIVMQYQKDDLSDFLNKVQIHAELDHSELASSDLQKFYDGFGNSELFHIKTKFDGTLNNFTLGDLDMYSEMGSKAKGNFKITNAFSDDDSLALDAHFSQLESKIQDLKKLLPGIFNGNIPENFQKIGHFRLNGNTKVTGNTLNANVYAITDVGDVKTNLNVNNFRNMRLATYTGDLQTYNLNLGELLNNPSLGIIDIETTVKGKGFTFKSLNTQVNGIINQIQYNGYNYSGISLNGGVQKQKFTGLLTINDPNLKLDFEGLADFSKEQYDFDFKTHIERAELNKLNWFERDSLSVLKGDITMDMTGTTLENMQGVINFQNTTYTNQLKDYFFKDFTVTSQVQDSIQTLEIDSEDIMTGFLKGKFMYKELGKLTQNAIGSIYTNYKPYPVSNNQFIDFKFNIYNQAVAVFFPEITLGENTFIKGEIDSDKELFKLNFRSPEALAFENYFSKINLQIDNKNPLFNTQLSLDELKTKAYDIKDFYLVNVTLNDTLFFRSEFKGGDESKDQFNLSFYHTLNENNQSILAFQESEIEMNGTKWLMNPNEKNPNKIIYDPHSKLIDFQNFLLKSGEQTVTFFGSQQGSDYRDYNIDLDRVILSEILPDIALFDFDGLINGGIWIEKRNGMLIPKADVQIVDFTVNHDIQGDLIGEIKGSESNREYDINIYLEKDAKKSMTTAGTIDFTGSDPMAYLVMNFMSFDISPLNALGQGVMENIRGKLSGEAGINGKLTNPVLSGMLTLEGGGLYFPYIHVDYGMRDNSIIMLNNRSFELDNIEIFDTKYGTKGKLNGKINHNKFQKWNLDLKLDTNNLLALDKPEKEADLFYGTGYLNGVGYFKGDTDNINIQVIGSSNPGTNIIIPMSDDNDVVSSKLIHFKEVNTETIDKISEMKRQFEQNFKGLTMNFDFDVNKNALIKIVIDEATGSFIEGRGNGNILMDIDTRGSFNMYGNYEVEQGIYNFKYGAFINKPFTVKEGGSITFVGDPYKAELDIEAIYTVRANPKVILSDYTSNRNVPVQLTTKITGELFNSKQEFDITIPNAGVDLSSELNFALNKQDSGNLMRQFVSLLTLGSFYNENDITTTTNSLGNEGITSAAMAISNALMDVFSDPDDRIKLGFNYNQGTQTLDDLYTDNQLGLTISGRFGKNENFIFNSEVLVPTGSRSNSNIAGVVSIETPINKKETLFLSVFNRQNEIQYSEEEEGYTQGLGLSWQINFDGKEEFLEKLGLRRKNEDEK